VVSTAVLLHNTASLVQKGTWQPVACPAGMLRLLVHARQASRQLLEYSTGVCAHTPAATHDWSNLWGLASAGAVGVVGLALAVQLPAIQAEVSQLATGSRPPASVVLRCNPAAAGAVSFVVAWGSSGGGPSTTMSHPGVAHHTAVHPCIGNGCRGAL
jgi:hypothetical protein